MPTDFKIDDHFCKSLYKDLIQINNILSIELIFYFTNAGHISNKKIIDKYSSDLQQHNWQIGLLPQSITLIWINTILSKKEDDDNNSNKKLSDVAG